MKKILLIIGIILVLAIITVIGKNIASNMLTPIATINSQSFHLYVAKTPKEKEIGLSKYKTLPQNYAMLFPFDQEGFHSFWMKDMKFALDIIFIKGDTIVTIHRNALNPNGENSTSLPIYMSTTPSDLVLEINAGLSEKYDFQEGDTVILKNLKEL